MEISDNFTRMKVFISSNLFAS